MTVSSTTNRKSFTGNGATTSFATSPMVFFDTSDLKVYVVTTATGAATLLTENTHYTVSGGDGSTGTVSLAGGSAPYGAPSAAQTLLIVRELPLTQAADFANNDASDAEVVEDALDRLTIIAQQLEDANNRALTLPTSDVTGVSTELPTPEASTLIGWNSAGTALENKTPADVDLTLVSAFAATLLDDADAAAARATLGAAARGANTDLTSVFLDNTGLKVKDMNASHGLTIKPGSNITADRTLTVTTGDADRNLQLDADHVLAGNASQAEAEAGADNAKMMTPLRTSQAIAALAAGFTSATAQATTSGTAWTFTGIPSSATVIIVMFSAFSTDGSSDILVQLGDSGGIENSGYTSSSASGGAFVTNSTGFVVADPVGASDSFNGMVILARLSSSSNTWVQIGGLHASAASRFNESSGSKSLSATLDRVSVTSVSADTGDAGSVNILYR